MTLNQVNKLNQPPLMEVPNNLEQHNLKLLKLMTENRTQETGVGNRGKYWNLFNRTMNQQTHWSNILQNSGRILNRINQTYS